MFFRNGNEGPSGNAIQLWRQRLADLLAKGGRIRLVQVYTVARTPANKKLGALGRSELEGIADSLEVLGVPVEVYPGS